MKHDFGTMAGLARLLRAVYDNPCTAVAFHQQHSNGAMLRNVLRALEGLASVRLIHRSGWKQEQVGYRRVWYAEWSYGPGEPAPLPAGARLRGRRTKRPTTAAIDLAAVLRAASDDARSAKQLSEVTGLSRTAVQRIVRLLHRDLHMLYVADWDRTERAGPWALYGVGMDRRDTARPKPQTANERNKKVWRVMKQWRDRQRGTRLIASNGFIFNFFNPKGTP